jgi:hypothetical protein
MDAMILRKPAQHMPRPLTAALLRRERHPVREKDEITHGERARNHGKALRTQDEARHYDPIFVNAS